MPDPLSITTGVLAILGVCAKVGWQLNQFQGAARVVDTTVEALRDDVNGIVRVLNALQETIRVSRASAFQETGHIGTHWRNLSTSISDGKDVLDNLHSLLEHVAKKTSLLNRPRMQLRYHLAEDQLAMLQLRLKSWRDTIQLSLCIVILWRQGEETESQINMTLSLKVFDSNIRRMADAFNQQIQKLEGTTSRGHDEEFDLRITTNLRECVRSAASVVSSASTAQVITDDGQSTIYASSDFEDCLPSGSRLDIQRWIDARTEYDYSVKDDYESREQHSSSTFDPGSDTETESELETDLMRILLTRGQELHVEGDFIAAQSSLENCVFRSDVIVAQSRLQLKSEVSDFRGSALKLLVKIHVHNSRWGLAQECLEKRLRGHGKAATAEMIEDMETLVAVHLQQQHYGEAHRYARKVLMAYRKNEDCSLAEIVDTLRLLITISKQQANSRQEEAYIAMLLYMGKEVEPVAETAGLHCAELPKPRRIPPPPPIGTVHLPLASRVVELPEHEEVISHQQIETTTQSDIADAEGFHHGSAAEPSSFQDEGYFEVQSDALLPLPEIITKEFVPEPYSVDLSSSPKAPHVSESSTSPPPPGHDRATVAQLLSSGSDCSENTTYAEFQSGLGDKYRSSHSDGIYRGSPSDNAMSGRSSGGSPRRQYSSRGDEFERRQGDVGSARASEPLSAVMIPNEAQARSIAQRQADSLGAIDERKTSGDDYAEAQDEVFLDYRSRSTGDSQSPTVHEPSTTSQRSQLSSLPRIEIPPAMEAHSDQLSWRSNYSTPPLIPSPTESTTGAVFPSTPTTITTEDHVSRTHSSRSSEVFTPVTEDTDGTVATETARLSVEDPTSSPANTPEVSFGHVRRRAPQMARFSRFVSTKIHGSRNVDEMEKAESHAQEAGRASIHLARMPVLQLGDDLRSFASGAPTKRPRSSSATVSVPTSRFKSRIIPLAQQQDSHGTSAFASSTDHNRIPAISRSVCCIGDGNSGKTGLLQRAATGQSPGYNAPTVIPETYSLRVETVTPSHAWVDLRMRDTSGNDGSERWLIRELEECHVVIVTFDLSDPSSLDNVRSKWIYGIRLLAPKKPIMLVGCRQDLARQQEAERMADTNSHMSSTDLDTRGRAIIEQRQQLTLRGRDMRTRIGAAEYVETSAWTGEGVDEMIRQAASIALEQEAAPGVNYRRSWHLRARSISNSATLLFAP